MRALLVASVAVAIASKPAAGADNSASPITTDRPAVTASSVVVPFGSLQIENGFADTLTQGRHTYDAPESLLRFGIASTTELRLITPNAFAQTEGTFGFGDVMIGLKQQISPGSGAFDASVILSLSLPAGAPEYSSQGYDPSVQVPLSRSLSQKWTVAGMLSVYWPTQGTGRNVTGQTTFLLDRLLTKRCDAFVEYAGDFPQRGGPRHLLHFGTAYRPRANQQLDVHVGIGLSASAVDHLIGVGYSVRWQARRR